MVIVFALKNGEKFKMKCEKFTAKTNGLGMLTSWEATGITENKPIYLPIELVEYIYREDYK